MKSTILRNGSGYYDPTAFGAIKNIIKSEKVKKVKTMEKAKSGKFSRIMVHIRM